MVENYVGRVYRTYLECQDTFNLEKIITDLHSERVINKPNKAWWGSSENAEYGWKEWCIDNEFGNYDWEHPIRWMLVPGTNIYRIYKPDVSTGSGIKHLERYLKVFGSQDYGSHYLDFEKMLENDIHAVELMDAGIGHYFINRYEMMFNCWDCESIVVLDPSKIILL